LARGRWRASLFKLIDALWAALIGLGWLAGRRFARRAD
jgi:hypothetical protein